MEFSNPDAKEGMDLESFAATQVGAVGDITASRKVKVPDIPIDEIGEYYLAKKPFPWHWGNSLYLEWFSQTNGRVVIESASYELRIVGSPVWEMSAEEEKLQQLANEKAMTGFMDTLAEVADGSASEGDPWNDSPQTEEKADRILHCNDILTDRIQARIEREGEGADFEQIIEQEIERMRSESGDAEIEWTDNVSDLASELELEFDDDEFDLEDHALAERAQELAHQLIEESREKKWVPPGAMEDHPAAYLVESVTKAAAKLAGALNGQTWPPEIDDCGMMIAQLKRARVYLDDAQTALVSCQEQKLIAIEAMGYVLVEVADVAKESDEIISELRDRLEEGR
ncbi:hypothetical protein [Pelagicoccus sp. SDUM812002]|uniref:hypothetical protein n=1 Tax=Pelagicoccus sp. SDUM812002 TaxID=3041266 RepID=UPI00280F1511|nr:hypothetical protein [Pelagicoccus sp. SDUM812002]MDQ8186956.1 hypothetical protein [Pelagicoccus sp. SDUM812002]